MPGTTLAYAVRKHEIQKMEKVKSLLWNQTKDHPQGSPYYYSVLYYGKSSSGGSLDPEDYRKRWDRSEVVKTHGFISRLIRKCRLHCIPLIWHEGRINILLELFPIPKFLNDRKVIRIQGISLHHPSQQFVQCAEI